MTHEILQSDIDLAERLLKEGQPDDEVSAALVRRGIEPGKAAALIADLHAGRPVRTQVMLPPELAAVVLSKRAVAEPNGSNSRKQPAPSRSDARASARAHAGGQKSAFWFWVIVLFLVGLAVVTAWVIFRHYAPNRGAGAGPTEAGIFSPRARAAVNPRKTSAELALEIRPGGLYVNGTRMTRDSALRSLTEKLGAPARTNRVGQSDRVIYVYDAHGLLVYARHDGVGECLVLDFEGLGGLHGATNAFAGTLIAAGTLLRPDTDSQTLRNFKNLGLTNSQPDGGILSGRCQDVSLSVAYLSSLDRLSLIELDLK
jgi:hypothetical protein